MRFVALAAMFAVGYFGAEVLANLYVASRNSQPTSAPALDDAYIAQRLQICVPPEPKEDDDRELLQRVESLRGGGWTVKEGDPKTWLPAAAVPGFLKCAGEIERKRFCNSSYRKQYASQLARYYSYLASWGVTSPIAALALKRQAEAEGRPGSNSQSRDIETGETNPVAQNPVILNTVRDLSRDGLLSARDFGLFGPPKYLDPVLEKEPRAMPRYCQQP